MALNSYNKRLNRGGNKDKVAIITGGSGCYLKKVTQRIKNKKGD